MGNDSQEYSDKGCQQEYSDKGCHPLTQKPQDPALAEKNLLVAVIERAIRDAILHPDSPILVKGSATTDARINIVHHRSALAWLWSNSTRKMSFIWIVRALGLSDRVVHLIRAEIPKRAYRPGDTIKPHRLMSLDFSAEIIQYPVRAA